MLQKMIPHAFCIFLPIIVLGACIKKPAVQSARTKQEILPPTDWEKIRNERDQELQIYLDNNDVAYRWFADSPFGETKDEHFLDKTSGLPGYPYLMLKLLPVVAPEQWTQIGNTEPDKSNFLSVIGLFKDERLPNYPIARGFGWTGLTRERFPQAADIRDMDFASITCGACHIGRVRLKDGKYKYIDAGVNSEFNLAQFRIRQLETLKRAIEIGRASNPQKTDAEAIADTFIAALEKAPEGFFYRPCSPSQPLL